MCRNIVKVGQNDDPLEEKDDNNFKKFTAEPVSVQD